MNASRVSRRTLMKSAGAVVGGAALSACIPVDAPSPAVQQRLKQAGMRWSHPSAQAMLALRARLLSGRRPKIPHMAIFGLSLRCAFPKMLY